MQPSQLPALLVLLRLTFVQGALVMTEINATVSVHESVATMGMPKLGPEFKMNEPEGASISCRLRDDFRGTLSSPSITWQKLDGKSDVSFTVTGTSDGHHSYVSTLKVEKLFAAGVAPYVCIGKSGNMFVNKTVAIMSAPLLRVNMSGGFDSTNLWVRTEQPDLAVRSNEAATVVCEDLGYPTGDAHWLRLDASGQETAVGTGPKLEFNKTSYPEDRGFYVCRSTNRLGKNSFKIYFRVQNPRAYLAPLMAVSCCIVIVAVISIIYEIGQREVAKRRAARQLVLAASGQSAA